MELWLLADTSEIASEKTEAILWWVGFFPMLGECDIIHSPLLSDRGSFSLSRVISSSILFHMNSNPPCSWGNIVALALWGTKCHKVPSPNIGESWATEESDNLKPLTSKSDCRIIDLVKGMEENISKSHHHSWMLMNLEFLILLQIRILLFWRRTVWG